MDESLRTQIESNLSHLDALIRRGRGLRESLAADPSDKSALDANRAWQQDIGVAINQLSGGSKAHWLARAFSEAFLLRASSGEVIDMVAPSTIVERLIAVLEQGVASLSQMEVGENVSVPTEAPPPRRFEFVHNAELRPVLEQAYLRSRTTLEEKRHDFALRIYCGILETIVTDALEHAGLAELAVFDLPAGKISTWSFEERLAIAEKARIIRGGCARLTPVARKYRDVENGPGLDATITEQDARRAGQVLHVVMKDLDPGR